VPDAQAVERGARTRRDALDRIAKRLLEREVLEHDELVALIAGAPVQDEAERGSRQDAQREAADRGVERAV
jgi:cell division protease FtsH